MGAPRISCSHSGQSKNTKFCCRTRQEFTLGASKFPCSLSRHLKNSQFSQTSYFRLWTLVGFWTSFLSEKAPRGPYFLSDTQRITSTLCGCSKNSQFCLWTLEEFSVFSLGAPRISSFLSECLKILHSLSGHCKGSQFSFWAIQEFPVPSLDNKDY